MDSGGQLSKRLILLLMFLAIATGTGLRLLVISQTAFLSSCSYSSYFKVSLNYADRYKEFDTRTGEWLDGEQIFEDYFILKADGPDFSGLFEQLARSNHPPLYYILLHSLISLSPDKTATLAKGFVINMAGFWLSAVLVFFLGVKLTGNSFLGLFAAFLYSVNPLSMEVFTLHKGYELQVTCILLIVYLVLSFQDKGKLGFFNYLFYFAACVLAFLIHYYSYLWVAGICLIIFVQYSWTSWNPDRLIRIAVTTVMAVFAAVLLYPSIISDLLTDHRSLEIQEKLVSPGSFFWLKIQGGASFLARYFLNLPFNLMMLLTFTAVLLAAILRPGELRYNRLFWKGKWISIALYAGVFFWLVYFLSPYQYLRYVSPVIPLLPLLAAGFLQVLPSSYIPRVAILASALFLSSSLFGFVRVCEGDIPSSYIISNWRTESIMEPLSEDGGVIVVSDRIREKWNPVFYHVSPRSLAVCIDKIPPALFNRPGEMLVLLDTRYPGNTKDSITDDLKRRNFKYAGGFRGFYGFFRPEGSHRNADKERGVE